MHMMCLKRQRYAAGKDSLDLQTESRRGWPLCSASWIELPNTFNPSTLTTRRVLSDSDQVTPGNYIVQSTLDHELHAERETPKVDIWFQTPPLNLHIIRTITQVQLVAESHDQGFADVPDAGNWTWLELAILNDAHAKQPKSVGGVVMVWTSHYNNFSR
ncbi:uncharacterized protein LY79DRAFT_675155 [Colletotrichum navitas]|uniref:Uncharacterized protein n=1 Tax=Colletotrichum navitas TaxID=681940 RepID=A0AAD8UXD0_9PEZI|nr:uncharacterized protein LY79DRAFT_675155 [Colletotrichum navitas]KAK1564265.1 hypothetical protein LY79DRAFT_675155 [Colletotrichum navitas]